HRHLHLVPAAEPHVVPVVLLIERVLPVGWRPLDAAVGYEQPAHDPHPAVRNGLARGIVVINSHAVPVVRHDVHPEPGPPVQPTGRTDAMCPVESATGAAW